MMKSFFQKYKYQSLLLLVVFILYGNIIGNGYALDDEFVTGKDNITAQGFKAIPKAFKTFHVKDESDNKYEYRPMVKVSFAIESGIFGENPKRGHFFNIIFYWLTLILLFKLFRLLFKEFPPFTLFLAVLIFAFIPVHSEVVVSLKNRDVLLSFIFTLLGFIQVIRYTDIKKWYRMFFALLLFALAYLSKFDVVPYIAIIPIILLKQRKINIKTIIGIVILFLLAFVMYKLTKRGVMGRAVEYRVFMYFENPLYFEKGFILKISAALNSLGFYAKMLLLPTKMASYYGHSVIQVFSFTSLYALLGLIISGTLFYFFIIKFNKPDFIWYGIVFFCFSISMYLNIVAPAPGIVADRFLFFASIGFSLILIQVLFFNSKTKKYPVQFSQLNIKQKSISLVILVFFGGLIISRNKEWKDRLTLFEADVKNYPESVKLSLLTSSEVIVQLSNEKSSIKQNDKLNKMLFSEKLLINAVKEDSTCNGCLNNLAYLYLSYKNDPLSALRYLKPAYARDTIKKELLANLGIAYFKLNKIDSAKYFLFKAVKSSRGTKFTVPYEVLGSCYANTNIKEGILYFESELKKQPDSELLNVSLGQLYFLNKDTLVCRKYYQQALNINPGNTQVSGFIGQIDSMFKKK